MANNSIPCFPFCTMEKLVSTLKISQNIVKITWNNIYTITGNFKITPQKNKQTSLHSLNSFYKIFCAELLAVFDVDDEKSMTG